MKSFTIAAAGAALIGAASAKVCQNITVPVQVSARNGKFDATALTTQSNIEVTNFILDLTQQGKNFTAEVLQGYETVTGTYNLAATYCRPDSGAPNVIQVLTHGIGFDRSYWDFPLNHYNYSYVNEAVDQYGFATIAYDRPGIGQSSHGEPVNEIQAYLEVSALTALTTEIRAGKVQGVPQFGKVVHVGHSFGSEHTYLLTAMNPKISDGIALTGFSTNGSFVPYFALGGNFVDVKTNAALAPQYAHGYLAAGDASAVQTNFFSPGAFDPAVLAAAVSTGQPVTIGELLTIGGEIGVPNTFAGPVLIVTGERDIPYCGGNCLAPPAGYASIPAAAKSSFKNAGVFDVVIVPGAGHGLNLEFSHPFTYSTINNFFVQNGASPKGAAASGSTSSSAPVATSSASFVTSVVSASSAAASASGGPWSGSWEGGHGGHGQPWGHHGW